MITEEKFQAQLALILSRFDSNIKELTEIVHIFKRDNPDANYYDIVEGSLEHEKLLDLAYLQAYVEDTLNGVSRSFDADNRKNGYSKSRTKKIRKAYGFNK
jgi:hypothetical protein